MDDIVFFKPLHRKEMLDIIDLLINDIENRLVDLDIKLAITESAKQHVIDEAYDVHFGARPMKRYLQKHIETMLGKEILKGMLMEAKK